MAIALVQSTKTTAGGTTSYTLAFGSNLGAASLLVAFATTGANTSITFSDNNGGSWTTIGPFFESVSGQSIAIGYAANHAAGATTVTVTLGTSAGFNTLQISEWSGAATSSVLDTNTAGRQNASSTTPSDASMTTAGNGELVVGCIIGGSGAAATAGTGFTVVQTDATNGFFSEYQVQTSAGSIACAYNISPSQTTGTISAAFKPPAAAASAKVPDQRRSAGRFRPRRPRSEYAQPPTGPRFNGSYPVPPQPQRRILPKWWRPRAKARATQPPTGPAFNGSYPVPPQYRTSNEARPNWPRIRRRGAQPPFAVTVTVTAGPLVPQARTSLRVPKFARAKARQAQPVPPQQTAAIISVPVQPPRRQLRPPVVPRGYSTIPVTVVVAVPPQPRRRIMRPLLRPRSRIAAPVPPQVIVVTAQALPPQPATRRRPWPWHHFGRGAQYIPAQQAITVVVPVTVTGSDRPTATVTSSDTGSGVTGTDRALASVSGSDRSGATVTGSDRASATVTSV
jgi:hypothetical protein